MKISPNNFHLRSRKKKETMGNQFRHALDNDLSLNDYRYLMKQTRLTPEVIRGWYREFLHVCPQGQLTKHEFIKFYSDLTRSSSKDPQSIAENVFRAFDRDGNNRIDFKEFLIAYALTSMGEPREKLEYTFSTFDIDHSETIDVNEMSQLLVKLCLITGNPMSPAAAESIAKDIFRTFNHDHRHSLSKEEFITGCLKHPTIQRVLSPF